MATELKITELDDALLVETVRQYSLLQSFFSAATGGAVTAFFAFYFLGWLPCVFLAFVGASIAFLYARRKQTFELKVAKEEFVSSGKVGDNFGSSRTLSAADVQRLEYQEDTSGPETAYHPEGLYARVKRNSICLLPDVNAQQTADIIFRIETKFPSLRELWTGGTSAFGQHFTSLGLGDPN